MVEMIAVFCFILVISLPFIIAIAYEGMPSVKRKRRLKLLKSARSKRDLIIASDNEGRKRKLLLDMPEVRKVSTQSGYSSWCSIRMDSGHEYSKEHSFLPKGLDWCAKEACNHLIRRID